MKSVKTQSETDVMTSERGRGSGVHKSRFNSSVLDNKKGSQAFTFIPFSTCVWGIECQYECD